MKTKFFTILLLAAASLMSGCSKQVNDEELSDQKSIPITFTVSTPGNEGVVYASTRAMTHDAAEYAIKQMTLMVYDATNSASPTFLRKHDMTQDISLYDNGNGSYSFTLEAPISDMNAKRKFVFVVNDDAGVASTEVGSTEDDLHTKTTASIELADGATADQLATADRGIAMSGTATSDGVTEELTITPGMKCSVKLTRIVARIDLQNNTPNMTLESAVLVGASKKGYLFPQTTVSTPTEERLQLGSHTGVDITVPHPSLSQGQAFAPKTFNKVFYAYERPNTTDDYAAVRITYRVNESEGTIEVPFIRTTGGSVKTPIDIERNHLYTIILGNGQPVETNPVEYSIRVEDWNVVEMPEEIGPGDPLDPASQAKLNANLKVSKLFTEYNAKTFDLESKTITEFYSDLVTSAADCPTTSYVCWSDLTANNALAATFTGPDGKYYRLPTAGELGLLLPWGKWETDNFRYHPWWNDNPSTNTAGIKMVDTPFEEILYLKNDSNNAADATHDEQDGEYTLRGMSQMKLGQQTLTLHNYPTTPDDPDQGNYNIYPVYALRFKGTSQYAAYRWEVKTLSMDPLSCYLSIKIKALLPEDNTTTLDDVADETFWNDGFVEIKFPASGYYLDQSDVMSDNIQNRGTGGYCISSSMKDSQSANMIWHLGFDLRNAYVPCYNALKCYFPLRFVNVLN